MRISKKTPLPPMSRGRAPKYPIGAMEVGDSLLFSGLTQQEVGGRIQHYVKKGWKFTTRKVKNGTRVWRIA